MVSNTFPNRLDGLLDEDEKSPAPRSKAQQAAARKNGKKSKGPKTPAGKAKSRLNAIKHGILARVIVPASDPRGDDRRYWQIRQELIAEFRAKRFSTRARIDNLAHDFLQLARCRSMIEILQRPSALAPKDQQRWDTAEQAKGNLRLLKRVLAPDGTMKTCSPQEAKRLAMLAARVAGQVEADFAEQERDRAEVECLKGEGYDVDEPIPNGPPLTKMSAEVLETERREEQEFNEQLKMVRTCGSMVTDTVRLERLLTGEDRYGRGERQCLRALLERIALNLGKGNWKWALSDLNQRFEKSKDQTLLAWAIDPTRLITLDEYCRRLERRIDRTLQRLREY